MINNYFHSLINRRN